MYKVCSVQRQHGLYTSQTGFKTWNSIVKLNLPLILQFTAYTNFTRLFSMTKNGEHFLDKKFTTTAATILY